MTFREKNRKVVLLLALIGGLTVNALPVLAQETQAVSLPKNNVVATVTNLYQASAIAISPDNTTVYVVSAGDVFVLDATNKYKIKKWIQNISAFNMAISPDGKTLYVTNANNPGQVLVIDTTQSTYPVTNRVTVGAYPAGLAATTDGKQLYVANSGFLPSGIEGTVSVIDTATLASTMISCNGHPFLVTFTPSGAQADVLNTVGAGFVQFIDAASGTVSPNVVAAGQVSQPGGMAAFANTTTGVGRLYICSDYNWVTVCDSTTGAVIKKILAVPSVSSQIVLGQPAITRNGKYLYVPYSEDDSANSQGTQVAMISVQTGQIVGTPITVGKEPVWAQVAPNGKTLFVASEFDGTVTVVDITP